MGINSMISRKIAFYKILSALNRSFYQCQSLDNPNQAEIKTSLRGYENSSLSDTETIDALKTHLNGRNNRTTNSVLKDRTYQNFEKKNQNILVSILVAFFLGISAGIWFSTGASVSSDNLTSTYAIDNQTPNVKVCLANGFSSMVFDQRLFVSFNPFNVYVTQPEVKSGCVLRNSNLYLLEEKKLVSARQVQKCKKQMNTFAFIGDLDNNPEITCVYHSEDALNAYIGNKIPEEKIMDNSLTAI